MGSERTLFGRELELEFLGGRLRDALAGRGGVVAVVGPPGIGKSELLAAAARAAGESGLGVLRARGGELEAGIAFGIARQLLEPAVLSASAAERRRLLAGSARLGASALRLVGAMRRGRSSRRCTVCTGCARISPSVGR